MTAAAVTWRNVTASRPFVIVVVILLVAAAGANVATWLVPGMFGKKRVELTKPLVDMPESFGDRFVLAKNTNFGAKHIIDGKERLRPDTIELLGTRDFITWYYLDTAHKDRSGRPDTFVRMHVVYYTGLLDAVPHVADICMLAGGAQSLGSTTVDWHVTDPPPGWQHWRKVKVRRSEFARGQSRTVVYYIFSVNGNPKSDRIAVRAALADPFQKHAYYAKIELSAGRMQGPIDAAEQEEVCRSFFAQAAGTVLSHLPSAETVKGMEGD